MLKLLRICVIGIAFAGAAHADPMPPDIARKLDAIFAASEAPGMVAAYVEAERAAIAGFGVARVGQGAAPDGRSLLRINSLTKLMTGEILAGLVIEGRVALDDPLQRYAPPGRRVPRTRGAPAITLMDLAAHTAGLPRDMPPGLSRNARWAWLERTRPLRAPGRVAEYSNAAYMFLGDAITRAAREPFAALLDRRIASPLGLADTTLTPSAEQCRRLMTNGRAGHPCAALHALDAMGGLYSTANDMARWMRAQLTATGAAALAQTPLKHRAELKRLVALDFAGETDAIAMGWLVMRLRETRVLQKTGGGGHFMNYVIFAPSTRQGLFITVTRSDIEMLRRLTKQANALMDDLIHARGER
jgi:D-alanyl-D-alanine-carboxypeptidase/D-alanyl-D-alanine-endopeptidase